MIQLFHEIAQLLYGAHWQAGVSGDLGIAERSIRRWSAGTDRIPPGVWNDLRDRLARQLAQTDRVHRLLTGLLSSEPASLRPTPNTLPSLQIDGVWFSMTKPDGKLIQVLARREIFDDLGFENSKVPNGFHELSASLYRAASVKFDLGELEHGIIVIDAHNFIPPFKANPAATA